MGNYHPILMKIDTQTQTGVLSSKITKAAVYGHFEDGSCRHLGIQVNAIILAVIAQIPMKFGTQANTGAKVLKGDRILFNTFKICTSHVR
jgi:hypothetical protein